jgi:hypothetical protein
MFPTLHLISSASTICKRVRPAMQSLPPAADAWGPSALAVLGYPTRFAPNMTDDMKIAVIFTLMCVVAATLTALAVRLVMNAVVLPLLRGVMNAVLRLW